MEVLGAIDEAAKSLEKALDETRANKLENERFLPSLLNPMVGCILQRH